MTENLLRIKTFYADAFQFFDKKRDAPPIEIEFYSYVGINHTIRVRQGRVFVRLAEICCELPLGAQKALAYILVAKLLRKPVPPAARQIYADAVKTPAMTAKAAANKRAKGRKVITSAHGEIYDLDEIFDRLNRLYFRNRLAKPVLSWSARKTYRILGHHDPAHETVVISKSLDAKTVPRHVVEFVVYHEMLHIYHPTEHRDGRRYNHTPEFRRDEKKFAHFAAAENWIERNAANLKRAAKR